jgi:hypothetical protein
LLFILRIYQRQQQLLLFRLLTNEIRLWTVFFNGEKMWKSEYG